MNEDYVKQCSDGRCGPVCQPPADPCGGRDRRECPCDDGREENDWGSWLPLLILLFFFCGGFSGLGFGGTSCGGANDGCCDNGGGSSWIILLILLFCFLNNGNGNDGRGGLLGGLF